MSSEFGYDEGHWRSHRQSSKLADAARRSISGRFAITALRSTVQTHPVAGSPLSQTGQGTNHSLFMKTTRVCYVYHHTFSTRATRPAEGFFAVERDRGSGHLHRSRQVGGRTATTSRTRSAAAATAGLLSVVKNLDKFAARRTDLRDHTLKQRDFAHPASAHETTSQPL